MTDIEYTTLDTIDRAAGVTGDRVTINFDDYPHWGEVTGIVYMHENEPRVAGWWLSDSDVGIVRIERPVVPVLPLPTEPGKNFYATVRGVPDTLAIATDSADAYGGICYLTPTQTGGFYWHRAKDIDASTVRLIDTTAVKA